MEVQRLTASCRDGTYRQASGKIYQVVLASGSESFIFSWHCPKISLSKPPRVFKLCTGPVRMTRRRTGFFLILAVAGWTWYKSTGGHRSIEKRRFKTTLCVVIFGCNVGYHPQKGIGQDITAQPVNGYDTECAFLQSEMKEILKYYPCSTIVHAIAQNSMLDIPRFSSPCNSLRVVNIMNRKR
jgi:hypothetical protein